MYLESYEAEMHMNILEINLFLFTNPLDFRSVCLFICLYICLSVSFCICLVHCLRVCLYGRLSLFPIFWKLLLDLLHLWYQYLVREKSLKPSKPLATVWKFQQVAVLKAVTYFSLFDYIFSNLWVFCDM